MWVNCYRIHQKSLNFIYPFKFYSNFTNKNVSWLHFSWATQYSRWKTELGVQYRARWGRVVLCKMRECRNASGLLRLRRSTLNSERVCEITVKERNTASSVMTSNMTLPLQWTAYPWNHGWRCYIWAFTHPYTCSATVIKLYTHTSVNKNKRNAMTAQCCMARKMCRHIRFTKSYNTI